MQISVVIPTYSRPDLLQQALQSIARQSHLDWEVVVVDDGSDPPVTPQQIAQIVGANFQLLRHPQSLGTATAKNNGIAAARGELITLLDDDDLLEPFALQSITSIFAANEEIDCLFLNITPFGQYAANASVNQGSALKKVVTNAESHRENALIFFGPALFSVLLQTTPIPMQRPVARPATWRLVGSFSPGIMCPEPAWAARAALLCKTALLSTPVYRWRTDGQNFASRPSMLLASRSCILDDRLFLLQQLKSGALGNRLDLCTLRTSIATLLLDQAVASLVDGNRMQAVRRLGHSLLFSVSWRSAKTAVRLLLPAPVTV